MTAIYIILLWLAWTCLGVWRFLELMGRKYYKEKWYDRVMLAPAFILAYSLGFVSILVDKVRGKD